MGPEFPWSAHARPRRAEKRSVRVGAAARILLKRFWPPTHDWDRAPGSFFARGHIWCKAVHFVEGRANTQLRTSADAYNRREVRPRFPGFGRPAYTHTSFGKSPSTAAKPRTPCTNDLRSPVSHKINSFQRTEKRRIGHGRHTLTQLSQAGRALRPPRPQNGIHTQANEKFSQRLANHINPAAAGPRVGRRRRVCGSDEGKRASIFRRRVEV